MYLTNIGYVVISWIIVTGWKCLLNLMKTTLFIGIPDILSTNWVHEQSRTYWFLFSSLYIHMYAKPNERMLDFTIIRKIELCNQSSGGFICWRRIFKELVHAIGKWKLDKKFCIVIRSYNWLYRRNSACVLRLDAPSLCILFSQAMIIADKFKKMGNTSTCWKKHSS